MSSKKLKKEKSKKEELILNDEPDIISEDSGEVEKVVEKQRTPVKPAESKQLYIPPSRFERRLSVRPFSTTPVSKQPRHYLIGVRTGDRSYSSTEANVYCRLMGTNGSTPEFKLQRSFIGEKSSKFEKGGAAQFSVETEDVGDVKIVHLRQDTPDVAQTWFLAYVTVRQEGQTMKKYFPYYKWVLNQEIDLLEGSATLPQNEVIDAVRATRTDYVLSMREHYRWSADTTLRLPGFVADGSPDTLPLDDQYDNVRKKFYYGRLAREITEELDIVNIPQYAGLSNWDSLEDLSLLFYDDFDAPRILDTWNEDVEFGRQYLIGANPLVIKRCDAVPDHFAITDKALAKVLPKGDSLESLAKEGRLYLADYALLDGVPTRSSGSDQRYVTAPLCLFYVSGEGNLLPIAIQLHQNAGDDNPVFTPADSEADWTIAKIWVRCADTQHHQVASHILSHHFMVEAAIVALLRNLHPAHPVYKLLRPHFHNTLSVNVMLRRELIDPNGPTAATLAVAGGGHFKLLERAFALWSFRDWIIPENLERRGVGDTAKLPHYYWRDDALLLWAAMLKFVRKVLGHHYNSDRAVSGDQELQGFAAEFSEKGTRGHDLPSKIESLPQLVEVVTAILFAATAGHSSVHYSHFDSYVSIPNQPRALYAPPPRKKGQPMETILTLLPVGDEAIASVGMAYELSRYSKNQVFLGAYPEPLFTDSAPLQFISEFQDDLWAVSRQIHNRNASAVAPYTFLLPERITASVTI